MLAYHQRPLAARDRRDQNVEMGKPRGLHDNLGVPLHHTVLQVESFQIGHCGRLDRIGELESISDNLGGLIAVKADQ